MAGIEQKSFSQADAVSDYGDQGKAEKVTLGMSGFGLGSESTVWLSTLKRVGAGSGTSSRTCRSSVVRSTTASTSWRAGCGTTWPTGPWWKPARETICLSNRVIRRRSSATRIACCSTGSRGRATDRSGSVTRAPRDVRRRKPRRGRAGRRPTSSARRAGAGSISGSAM